MITKGLNTSLAQINKLYDALKKSESQKKRFITLYKKTNKQLKEFVARSKQTNKGLFNMKVGMFGVLFLGMSMQRMFWGMLEPAMALTGMFEILTATLEVLFLPVALQLLDWLLPVFEALMNLPEPLKIFIGWLFLLAGALGFVITAFAFILLSIGTFVTGFGMLGVKLSGALTKSLSTGLSAGLAGLIAGFKTFLTILKGLAIGAIAIKMVWDLKEFVEKTKNLKDTILSFGDSLSLLGVFTGQPWIIGIGLAIKLMPLFPDVLKWLEEQKQVFDSAQQKMKEEGNLLGAGFALALSQGVKTLEGMVWPVAKLNDGINMLSDSMDKTKKAFVGPLPLAIEDLNNGFKTGTWNSAEFDSNLEKLKKEMDALTSSTNESNKSLKSMYDNLANLKTVGSGTRAKEIIMGDSGTTLSQSELKALGLGYNKGTGKIDVVISGKIEASKGQTASMVTRSTASS